jgi:general secretion pathway protein J
VRAARPAGGFTLIEVVIALCLVAALLAITFGGLRVGMAAWRQGDARAAQLQRIRSLNEVLARAVGGAYPYQRETAGENPGPPAFEGEADRLAFVTTRPPVPLAAPLAFTAVALTQEAAGLTIREGALPSRAPLADLAPVLVDGSGAALRFRYLRGQDRSWVERWDPATAEGLPAAVEITVGDQPPLVVPIRVTGS